MEHVLWESVGNPIMFVFLPAHLRRKSPWSSIPDSSQVLVDPGPRSATSCFSDRWWQRSPRNNPRNSPSFGTDRLVRTRYSWNHPKSRLPTLASLPKFEGFVSKDPHLGVQCPLYPCKTDTHLWPYEKISPRRENSPLPTVVEPICKKIRIFNRLPFVSSLQIDRKPRLCLALSTLISTFEHSLETVRHRIYLIMCEQDLQKLLRAGSSCKL